MVSLIGIAAASRTASAASSASRRSASTPARARRGSSAARAAERLLDAGFDAGDVERILELVPLATHNQRGLGTLLRRHVVARRTPSGSSSSSRRR